MVKLKQVISAILTEITQAQATSDIYSRDLKSSYREDPFLKQLSVPKTEIKDVTIDLKFAIIKTDVLPESKVFIYVDANYQGQSQELKEGSYDVANLAIGDNTLSSLKVPKGIKVTLYGQPGFSGLSKSFTEDTPWVGDDFNDITSSIKVEQISMTNIESMDIDVNTNSLENLPEAAVSSISIKLDMTRV